MARRDSIGAAGARGIRPTPVGRIRRTQLITTYGVGAMVAADERSFIVTGIDRWSVTGEPDLQEFRLQRRLGVGGFRLPPIPAGDEDRGDGIHVRLFPEWYTCPGRSEDRPDGCENNLGEYRSFNSPRNRNECARCGQALTPSRFVVACDRGHLDDFPYWDWVHRQERVGETGSDHRLSFTASGRTSALRSIVISCSCGMSASMEGSFGRGALLAIGYRCQGAKPWLGRGVRDQHCDGEPRALQRGSSSAWFGVTQSALSIPPFSRTLHRRITPHLGVWAGEDDEVIARQATRLGLTDHFPVEEIVGAVREQERYAAGEQPDPSEPWGADTADLLREEEYKQLLHEADTPDFATERADTDPSAVAPGLASVMAVTRLREVRALQAFTRVDPPAGPGDRRRYAALSGETRPFWLPAVEVIGEGVFLTLDAARLERWESVAGPQSPSARAERIRRNHETSLRGHGIDPGEFPSPVTPRLVLLHTLGHVLIDEWSLDAGYPAASLRERLYVSDSMAGLLVYTATSDSAGSLGGLVERARPAALAASLRSAVARAGWCSSDPLCMEADAAGVDNLNLAACHGCVLLPETSCEHNNTFLDRAFLVGAPDAPTTGYFADVVAEEDLSGTGGR